MKKNWRSDALLPQLSENLDTMPRMTTFVAELKGVLVSIAAERSTTGGAYISPIPAFCLRRTDFSLSTSKDKSSPTRFSSVLGPHRADIDALREVLPSVRSWTDLRL